MKKYKSQCKAGEVTLKARRKTLQIFVWISSKNSASEQNRMMNTILPSVFMTALSHHGEYKPAGFYNLHFAKSVDFTDMKKRVDVTVSGI